MKTLYKSIKTGALALTLLVSSCAKVQRIDPEIVSGNFKSELLFNFAPSTTKASTSDSDIRRLDIMLFSGGKLEKVLKNITAFSTSTDGYSSVAIEMDTRGTRQAYVVANLDNPSWLNSLSVGSTTIKELASLHTANLTQMARSPLVMHGISGDIYFGEAQNSVSCRLYSAVARIDVANRASNFTLTSARLLNSKVSSTIFPNNTISNSAVVDFEAETADRFTPIRLYSYENDAKDDERATKVEISGIVNGVPKTYTLNLTQNGRIIPLERSYLYTVNINDVQSDRVDATTTVRPWKLDSDISEVVSGSRPVVDITIDREVGAYSKQDSTLTITTKGGQIIFDAEANAECAIDIRGDWVSLAAPTKAGSVIEGRFIVNATENTTDFQRTATIRIFNKLNNAWNKFTVIQPRDAVLSFKISLQPPQTAINYLYAFISYMAQDGTTPMFEKIADGENLNTINRTLPAGSYSANSPAVLYILANTGPTLGNISTANELERALESKKTWVIGDNGSITVDTDLVATRKINLSFKAGIFTAVADSPGVNNDTISLKRLSARVYVASSTGKQSDIAGYKIKLENVSSSASYFTYEGSGSSSFAEYALTGNADGQYSVNGKQAEAMGYFYPSTKVKVTVSHPGILNHSISQYISIKSDTDNTIMIDPYAYYSNYPKQLIDAGMEVHTVFYSGNEANSVRIPCVVTARDGSLLTFCETRYNTWKDQSYTDVAVKRSTDNGKTWSSTINITGSLNRGEYAFMDPTAVVDAKYSGKVFMFCVRRTCAFNSDITRNVTYMFTSNDNGATWDSGKVVDKDIVHPGYYSAGPGPASGIQLQKGMFAGRMIFPMRQSNGGSLGTAIYSDNGGSTWGILNSSLNAGEAQIAEVAKNQLYFNVRRGTDRYYSTSINSGAKWTARQLDSFLPSFESGCQASVIGNGENVLLYCGPKGGAKRATHDNRFELTLYRSFNGGVSWENTQLLYNLASSYSDMTILNDGRLAIVFECGPEKGFVYATVRPAGWMQIQMLILPKEVFSRDYWFDRI